MVLSGEGPSFCAGLDIKSFSSRGGGGDLFGEVADEETASPANLAQRVAFGWRELEVPVIAALQGNCLGGGLQIALGADIRIAAPGTKMSVMEIRYGLIPDMSLTRTLPRLVRDDVARELTYTGRVVETDEALSLGLLTRIARRPDRGGERARGPDRRGAAEGDPLRQAAVERDLARSRRRGARARGGAAARLIGALTG